MGSIAAVSKGEASARVVRKSKGFMLDQSFWLFRYKLCLCLEFCFWLCVVFWIV